MLTLMITINDGTARVLSFRCANRIIAMAAKYNAEQMARRAGHTIDARIVFGR